MKPLFRQEDGMDVVMKSLDPYADLPENDRKQLKAAVEAASQVNGAEWSERYGQIIQEAIAFFDQAVEEEEGWEFIPPPDKQSLHVQLFVRADKDGSYTCKAIGVLKGRPSRIAYLNRDNDWSTRAAWDKEDLLGIEEKGTFHCGDIGKVCVVESKIKAPRPLWDRYSIGIQWVDFDKKTGQHKIVFRTAPHFFNKCPNDMVSITASTGVWVAPRAGPGDPMGKKKCECIMVAKVHPGGAIPNAVVNLFYEKLRARMLLYEEVVANWSKYYNGKNPRRKRTPEDERRREREEAFGK